jgi:hypothetical protein
MTDTITLPRATVQQALDAMRRGVPTGDITLVDWHRAISALDASLEQPNECRWLQDGDEDSNIYMASCNRRYFELEDGAPTDNHMKYCCYCGKPLVEVPIEPEDNHD